MMMATDRAALVATHGSADVAAVQSAHGATIIATELVSTHVSAVVAAVQSVGWAVPKVEKYNAKYEVQKYRNKKNTGGRKTIGSHVEKGPSTPLRDALFPVGRLEKFNLNMKRWEEEQKRLAEVQAEAEAAEVQAEVAETETEAGAGVEAEVIEHRAEADGDSGGGPSRVDFSSIYAEEAEMEAGALGVESRGIGRGIGCRRQGHWLLPTVSSSSEEVSEEVHQGVVSPPSEEATLSISGKATQQRCWMKLTTFLPRSLRPAPVNGPTFAPVGPVSDQPLSPLRLARLHLRSSPGRGAERKETRNHGHEAMLQAAKQNLHHAVRSLPRLKSVRSLPRPKSELAFKT
jgi:hypothetical protein